MEKTQRIGKYIIDEELAQSNVCAVYRATEESLQRPVLIKKLHPQMAREDDIRSRFEREAQVCAHVNHENIVSIYGYHAEPDLTMLVLEFVEGRNLGELIAEAGIIDWRIVLAILHKVLKGLAFAHNKGVIHRDLKPDNILISHEGQVKIADFGLATIEDAPKLTRQGMVLGTPAYLPPEGLTGAPPDIRSDLFSIGATFYEVSTGTSPFHAETFSETMNKILKFEPDPPSSINPEIPRELDQIIGRLLEKNPVQRYATADQALEDVKRVCSQYELKLDNETIRNFLDSLHENERVKRSKARTKSSLSGILTQPLEKSVLGSDSIRESVKLKEKSGNQSGVHLVVIILIGFAIIAGVFFLPNAMDIDYISPVYLDESFIFSLRDLYSDSDELSTVDSDQDFKQASKSAGEVPHAEPQEKPQIDLAATGSEQPEQSVPPESNDLKSSNELVNNSPVLTGNLFLTTKQWANVFVDEASYGQTPLAESIDLPAGDHLLVLSNEEFPGPVVIPFNIQGGENVRFDVDLMTYFAIVKIRNVKPWAEIFVDKVSYGLTPRSRPIILTFGNHLIELVNPNFQTWRKELNVTSSDAPIEINVHLQALSAIE